MRLLIEHIAACQPEIGQTVERRRRRIAGEDLEAVDRRHGEPLCGFHESVPGSWRLVGVKPASAEHVGVVVDHRDVAAEGQRHVAAVEHAGLHLARAELRQRQLRMGGDQTVERHQRADAGELRRADHVERGDVGRRLRGDGGHQLVDVVFAAGDILDGDRDFRMRLAEAVEHRRRDFLWQPGPDGERRWLGQRRPCGDRQQGRQQHVSHGWSPSITGPLAVTATGAARCGG